ncbi:MAG: GNAT family N-acetyltransferase [Cyclobacteriaceae bacterium]
MLIRVARVDDIKQIQLVRMAVIENALSDSSKVNVNDYFEFLTTRGRGWACEINKEIVGFSIVDFERNSIWALFVKPEFEQKGIGRRLHNTMLTWYFAQTQENVWLTTSANTKAELFYTKSGWAKVGVDIEGEIKFEMTYDSWRRLSNRVGIL